MSLPTNPPSLAELAHNALSDIVAIPKGLGEMALADIQGKNGATPDQMLANNAIQAGKGMVDEYGNLIGVTAKNGQPIFDPNKSVFEPGGVNTSGIQFNPMDAAKHAYEHPVNTALDLLPVAGGFKGEGSGAGVEPAAVVPGDVPDTAVKSFASNYTIPTKRAGTNDLNVMDTSKKILQHVKSGMDINNVDNMPDMVTGDGGIVTKMTRDALGKVQGEVPLGNPVNAAKSILDSYKIIVPKEDAEQIYADINNGTPVGNAAGVDAVNNIQTMNPQDAFDFGRNLIAKGKEFMRQDTYTTPNLRSKTIGKAYMAAGQEVLDQIDNVAGDQNVLDGVKTPENMTQLQGISPLLAQQVKNASTISQLRSTAAPFVRLGLMQDLTEQAGNSAAMKVAQGMNKSSIGPATVAGGAAGSMLGPMGTAGGAAIGNMVDRAFSPIYQAAQESIERPIKNAATNFMMTDKGDIAGDAAKSTIAAAQGGHFILPVVAQQSANKDNNGGQNEISEQSGQNYSQNNHGTSIAQGVNTHMATQDIKSASGVPLTVDEYNQKIQDPAFAPGSNARQILDSQFALTKQTATQNMPGNIPLFMGTASQALNKVQSLNNVNLNGLSQVFNKLKQARDFQSYTSNASNPYATELQTLDSTNNYFKQAYADVTGSAPGDNYTIKPGDSAEQIKEKIAYQTKWINDSYSHYQPYWDAVNPTSQATIAQQTGNQPPPTSGNVAQNASSVLPSTPGALPAGFQMTQGGLPPIGSLPAQ